MPIGKFKIKLTPELLLCIFVITHIVLWSILPLLREILPIDASECIIWGSYIDFGTNKHPPLAGWLAYFVYSIFKSDFSIYLLGQLFIGAGFIYIYKIGKLFFSDIKALFAVLLLEISYIYTYMGIYEGFNPNFLLLFFLPFLTYYFYKCIHEDGLKNWIILGLGYGLAFIGKYQTIMLFASMLTYLVCTKNGRTQFKKKEIYIAGIIALLCILPHFTWLYNHDLFSLNYFRLCELKYSNVYFGWMKHIEGPILFIINLVLPLITLLFVYFTAIKFTGQKICINKKINNDALFLIATGILPIIFQTTPAVINGSYLVPQWGYCLLYMVTILLLYFFPFDLSKKAIKYMTGWILVSLIITYSILGYVYYTERSFASRFPVQQVTKTLSGIYLKETGKPLKYIGGFIELTIPLELYNKDIIAVMDTYKYKNPWIDEEDLKKSGAIIIGRDPKLMKKYVRSTFIGYDKKFKVKKFYIVVKNHFGKQKAYDMLYVIIPPYAN